MIMNNLACFARRSIELCLTHLVDWGRIEITTKRFTNLLEVYSRLWQTLRKKWSVTTFWRWTKIPVSKLTLDSSMRWFMLSCSNGSSHPSIALKASRKLSPSQQFPLNSYKNANPLAKSGKTLPFLLLSTPCFFKSTKSNASLFTLPINNFILPFKAFKQHTCPQILYFPINAALKASSSGTTQSPTVKTASKSKIDSILWANALSLESRTAERWWSSIYWSVQCSTGTGRDSWNRSFSSSGQLRASK